LALENAPKGGVAFRPKSLNQKVYLFVKTSFRSEFAPLGFLDKNEEFPYGIALARRYGGEMRRIGVIAR
jgi:hypothetical protein